MNVRRRALSEAVMVSAETYMREARELAEWLRRAEDEVQGAGTTPPPRPLAGQHAAGGARSLTPEADTMTTAQYLAALETLGLTSTQAAPVLGVSVRRAFDYQAGADVPRTVVKLLQAYLRHGLPEQPMGLGRRSAGN